MSEKIESLADELFGKPLAFVDYAWLGLAIPFVVLGCILAFPFFCIGWLLSKLWRLLRA